MGRQECPPSFRLFHISHYIALPGVVGQHVLTMWSSIWASMLGKSISLHSPRRSGLIPDSSTGWLYDSIYITVCSLQENLALHWFSMESEVFLEWTAYRCRCRTKAVGGQWPLDTIIAAQFVLNQGYPNRWINESLWYGQLTLHLHFYSESIPVTQESHCLKLPSSDGLFKAAHPLRAVAQICIISFRREKEHLSLCHYLSITVQQATLVIKIYKMTLFNVGIIWCYKQAHQPMVIYSRRWSLIVEISTEVCVRWNSWCTLLPIYQSEIWQHDPCWYVSPQSFYDCVWDSVLDYMCLFWLASTITSKVSLIFHDFIFQ